jgi:hypothetical protein
MSQMINLGKDRLAEDQRKLAATQAFYQNQSKIPTGSASQAAPSGGPKVGDVEGGYKFKGGNPAVRANWVKQ